ncbi:MAG: NADH-quinone reductase, partial [Deltaproteobacteria bacterium]|nr:NADH-quinone reductase [Deltaproteobacteria bacterium]
MRRSFKISFLLIVMMICVLSGKCRAGDRFIRNSAFKGDRQIIVTFAGPVSDVWANDISNFTVNEKPDPDIMLEIEDST